VAVLPGWRRVAELASSLELRAAQRLRAEVAGRDEDRRPQWRTSTIPTRARYISTAATISARNAVRIKLHSGLDRALHARCDETGQVSIFA
jgi:hypothetical protein